MSNDDAQNSGREDFWARTRKAVFGWFGLVSAAVVAAAVVVVLGIGGSDSSKSESEKREGRSNLGLTVENVVRGGVWSLKEPIMEHFGSRDERPADAYGWIPNGTAVIAECARIGHGYQAEVEGEFDTWHWYAQLKNGTWLPMAGFQETMKDGPFGLRICEP